MQGYLKRTYRCFLHKKLRKAKIKTFCNVDVDADVNADADAEISKWPFIYLHILPNILKSKGNQTIKFGQLMEYNVRNLFLEKSYTEYGGKTIPRPFSKKSKLSLSQDQKSKFLCSLYLLYTKF